jgi:hypothetical protein
MTSLDRIQGLEEPFSYQAMQVVAAARQWAASIWTANERQPVEFMDELPTVTIGTEEEQSRRALLDAVHDLENFHQPLPRREQQMLPSVFDPPA